MNLTEGRVRIREAPLPGHRNIGPPWSDPLTGAKGALGDGSPREVQNSFYATRPILARPT